MCFYITRCPSISVDITKCTVANLTFSLCHNLDLLVHCIHTKTSQQKQAKAHRQNHKVSFLIFVKKTYVTMYNIALKTIENIHTTKLQHFQDSIIQG